MSECLKIVHCNEVDEGACSVPGPSLETVLRSLIGSLKWRRMIKAPVAEIVLGAESFQFDSSVF